MLEPNSPSKTFLGVRFVLFGFDPISESQVRAKLISGGGVDAGQYNQNCTHVIVDQIVHDDPRCRNARNDGKTLVTGLWVDHSYDIGMAVDATSIMYKPPKDLKGIPGAQSLVLCLTGYQRQDREDIMTMVSLMGAQFSKPLVANKVTHLLCYKFEGEKYELANKLKKIKLVNHLWLEDCLRYWQLLPEDNYFKSGYEMEMMQAEAKDSEEDAENTADGQSSRKVVNKSPELKVETLKPSPLSKSIGKLEEKPRISNGEGLPSSVKNKSIPGGNSKADPSSGLNSNSEMAFQTDTCSAGTSVGLPDPQQRTPNSRIGGSGSESLSRSAEKSHSDAKFSAISYTRKTPRKSPSSLFSGEPSNVGGSLRVKLSESSSGSAAEGAYGKNMIGSCQAECVQGETPSNKRQKTDVSCSNSKQQKTSRDSIASVTKCPSLSSKTRLEPLALVDGIFNVNNNSFLDNNDHAKPDVGSPDTAQKLNPDASSAKSSIFEKKSFAQGPSFHENIMQDTTQNESLNGKMSQTFARGFRKPSFADKPERDSKVENSEYVVVEGEGLSHHQQDKQSVCPFNRKSEVKPQGVAMEELQEGSGNLITKPVRKKTVAKRTWGSRPALKNTAKQKGAIYFNKAAPQNDPQMFLSGERADIEKSDNATKPEKMTAAVKVTKEAETRTGRSSNNVENETNVLDDETEAPEDKDESMDLISEEKAEVADLSHKANNIVEIEPEGVQHATDSTAACMDGIMKQKDESSCKGNSLKSKLFQSKKKALHEARIMAVPNISEESESKNVSDGKGTKGAENIKGKAIKKGKAKPTSAGHLKNGSASAKNIGRSTEVEKENKPIVAVDQSPGQAKDHFEKQVIKASMNIQQKSRKGDPNCTATGEYEEQVKAKPIWFILSGHRLQRKEFQQVIRRLKGKFCRDSHQWSYQATHFIAPDPIRRTEKFFAAAASGRWILKTDYLSACSQAGKFLDEEPYEWYKNGLSEDGAINLDAPRKWRLLREKTGHGTFNGMRIVIYGECIAPPLDTLKRVVKAGDGTILATSPPYTRFLSSGVDYAIISPGMPRADIWVQEFLRHEIPCVVADYLVEYVCKPGYSLERHVLYNTHAWAKKSFANLLSNAEEIVENLTASNNSSDSDNDIACQVCGSRDRGDVMLICGDENGSVGCGVGMHMDCCDPPLENIPEDDWFCPNCGGKNSSGSNISPKRRKGSSLVKAK